MAKIFKTDSQEKALKDIVDSLKIIDAINRLVKDENIQDMERNIWDAQVLLPEWTILQSEYILDGKLAHINSQVLVMVKTD